MDAPLATFLIHSTITLSMHQEHFFRDPALPFVECRTTQASPLSFKPHLHASVSIGTVDEGEVEYTVGDHRASLRPGSLALINPETLHSCNTLNNNRRSYSMLYLTPSWCLKVQSSLWQTAVYIPFAVIRLDDVPLYDQYRLTVHHLLSDTVHLQEKEQLLVELASTVFNLACRPTHPPQILSGNVARLKKLLRNDLHRDLTLDSLAQQLEANPYTLLRTFKAQTGITPHAYRMNCRIELAKTMLRQGKDITDTALECGFFDQSHMHRHFKAMTTVTPQEYRNNFFD